MFIKLVVMIALGAMLSFSGPAAKSGESLAGNLVAEAPHDFLSLCVGPMTMGFSPNQTLPFSLSFADKHSVGFAGIFGVHIHGVDAILKTRPSIAESAQKLPRRLPSLP